MVVMPTPRHDPAEIRRLLELRRAEKLTFGQLSERSGVAVHVLTYRAWQDRRGRAARRKAPECAAFVEVVGASPAPEPAVARNSSGIELMHPGGLRIQLERNFDEAALARLLTVVLC